MVSFLHMLCQLVYVECNSLQLSTEEKHVVRHVKCILTGPLKTQEGLSLGCGDSGVSQYTSVEICVCFPVRPPLCRSRGDITGPSLKLKRQHDIFRSKLYFFLLGFI